MKPTNIINIKKNIMKKNRSNTLIVYCQSSSILFALFSSSKCVVIFCSSVRILSSVSGFRFEFSPARSRGFNGHCVSCPLSITLRRKTKLESFICTFISCKCMLVCLDWVEIGDFFRESWVKHHFKPCKVTLLAEQL